VVQDGGLGRPGRAGVVMRRDRVKQLRLRLRVERLGTLLDQPEPEVDVAEQPALRGLAETGAGAELRGAADVVEQRGGEEQVAAQPRVELAELAADRRDADGVLEQPAGVVVMPVRCGRQRAQQTADLRITDEAPDRGLQPGMGDLLGEELEEPVELVRVAAHRRGKAGRVGLGRRLDRAHVELEAVAVALDTAEDAHRVAFGEPAVEQVDVVPDPSLDPPARVDQLEREVRRATLRAEPTLAGDGIHTLDDAVLRQLGDRAHSRESRLESGLLGSRRGRGQAVSGAALRRAPSGAARLARRPAVRRDLGRGPRALPDPQSVQRRQPDPAR
jgi:hypothetical protein